MSNFPRFSIYPVVGQILSACVNILTFQTLLRPYIESQWFKTSFAPSLSQNPNINYHSSVFHHFTAWTRRSRAGSGCSRRQDSDKEADLSVHFVVFRRHSFALSSSVARTEKGTEFSKNDRNVLKCQSIVSFFIWTIMHWILASPQDQSFNGTENKWFLLSKETRARNAHRNNQIARWCCFMSDLLKFSVDGICARVSSPIYH
jgi:hypothetical protein